ncbi:hypothetical protein ACP4OV_008833 [Aristida adscensionis]
MPPRSLLSSLSPAGLGYSIAIALGLLIPVASLLLAFCFCFRRGGARGDHWAGELSEPPSPASSSGRRLSVTVERVFPDAAYSWPPAAAAAAPFPAGLHPAAIASYPTVAFSSSAAARAGADADTTCAICLGEYADGETLRVVPSCLHRFHAACLDGWLRLNASCPVCRSPSAATALSWCAAADRRRIR